MGPRWGLVISVVLATIPFVRGFSATHVFFVRDLGLYFWPRHLWFWTSMRSLDLPLWDPYAAGGQSAVADALNQFFLLPVVVVRVLSPAVVGFNFWIIAPYPLMAAGMFAWLNRRYGTGVAIAGSTLFVVTGPVLSSGNFPNLSWTIAFLPWTLWALDRLCERIDGRRLAWLALFIGLQGLSGEPVTSAATGAMILGYAAFAVGPSASTGRWTRVFAAGGAGIAGVLLAAVQVIPMLSAASRSMRGVNIDATYWSLHPLSALEAVMPHVFGHVYHGNIETLPWLRAVSTGREPLFYSLYVGVAMLGLALVRGGGGETRAWRRFWWSVAALSLVFSLGEYTPVYGAAQRWIPVLNTFRFPLKYTIFTVLALTVLAADGMHALWSGVHSETRMPRASSALTLLGFIAVASGLFGVAGLLSLPVVDRVWSQLATLVAIDDVASAVTWIRGSDALWLRLCAISAGGALLLLLVSRQHAAARLCAVLVCGLAVADPLIVNIDLHPTIEASRLGPPEWLETTRQHPGDRVYVGGRISTNPGRHTGRPQLLDSPGMFRPPIEMGVQEAIVIYSTRFAFTPAAWNMRELISYDLPQLWPREYVQLLSVFRKASREERIRFLQRTGHRYCYLPEPPPGSRSQTPLASSPIARPMALYECGDGGTRVYLTPAARIEPDLTRQLQLLFDESHDPSTVVLLQEGQPSTAADQGMGPGTARVVSETQSELVVETEVAGAGAYLNVQDSYDPNWIAEVDGERQPLLRANGVFRAVYVQSGAHRVRLYYRPIPLYVGAAVTLVTALLLLGTAFQHGSPKRAALQSR